MSANDDAAHPWLTAEKRLIAEAVAGACRTGACASACSCWRPSLGAERPARPGTRGGPADRQLTTDAAGDPVFAGAPPGFGRSSGTATRSTCRLARCVWRVRPPTRTRRSAAGRSRTASSSTWRSPRDGGRSGDASPSTAHAWIGCWARARCRACWRGFDEASGAMSTTGGRLFERWFDLAVRHGRRVSKGADDPRSDVVRMPPFSRRYAPRCRYPSRLRASSRSPGTPARSSRVVQRVWADSTGTPSLGRGGQRHRPRPPTLEAFERPPPAWRRRSSGAPRPRRGGTAGQEPGLDLRHPRQHVAAVERRPQRGRGTVSPARRRDRGRSWWTGSIRETAARSARPLRTTTRPARPGGPHRHDAERHDRVVAHVQTRGLEVERCERCVRHGRAGRCGTASRWRDRPRRHARQRTGRRGRPRGSSAPG